MLCPHHICTPSDKIVLYRDSLQRTKLACKLDQYATMKNDLPSVITQNYLASCDTTRYFDWLCILLMNKV